MARIRPRGRAGCIACRRQHRRRCSRHRRHRTRWHTGWRGRNARRVPARCSRRQNRPAAGPPRDATVAPPHRVDHRRRRRAWSRPAPRGRSPASRHRRPPAGTDTEAKRRGWPSWGPPRATDAAPRRPSHRIWPAVSKRQRPLPTSVGKGLRGNSRRVRALCARPTRSRRGGRRRRRHRPRERRPTSSSASRPPAPRWSASARPRKRRSAAPCARPWSGR